MVVKYIKKSVESNTESNINNNTEEYLKTGTLYHVYGIRISESVVYYMIFFEQRHLIEISSESFDIIDAKLPALWEFKIEEKNITFWPKLFHESDFFENFSDWEDNERKEFSKIRIFLEG